MASPQCQLADSHLGITDVIQHQRLNVIDVVNAGMLELELYHIKKKAVRLVLPSKQFGLDIHCTFPLRKQLQNGQPAPPASAPNPTLAECK